MKSRQVLPWFLSPMLLTIPMVLYAQSNVQDFAHWAYVRQSDAMSDAPRDIAFTVTEGDQPDVAVGVKCMVDGANFILLFSDPTVAIETISMNGNKPTFQYRFDQDAPLNSADESDWYWDNKGKFMARPIDAATLQKFEDDSKLAIRLFDPDDGTVIGTYTYRLDGSSQAISRLRCLAAGTTD